LAQQGRFMVTNVCDVEDFIRNAEATLGKRHLYAADVPVSSAAEVLRDLAFMGLTAAGMFPGLDGIALTIKHQMFFARAPEP
jgi:hypothetical protein